jgi:hypothetical protein
VFEGNPEEQGLDIDPLILFRCPFPRRTNPTLCGSFQPAFVSSGCRGAHVPLSCSQVPISGTTWMACLITSNSCAIDLGKLSLYCNTFARIGIASLRLLRYFLLRLAGNLPTPPIWFLFNVNPCFSG